MMCRICMVSTHAMCFHWLGEKLPVQCLSPMQQKRSHRPHGDDSGNEGEDEASDDVSSDSQDEVSYCRQTQSFPRAPPETRQQQWAEFLHDRNWEDYEGPLAGPSAAKAPLPNPQYKKFEVDEGNSALLTFHVSSECSSVESERSSPPPLTLCTHCKSLFHVATQCQKFVKYWGAICEDCGRKGHFTVDCCVATPESSSSSDSIPWTPNESRFWVGLRPKRW